MIKLGIRAHDIGQMSCKVLADQIFDLGFDGVQLVFKKALTEKIDYSDLNMVKSCFKHLKIFMLGAYFNPVHPDPKVVVEGIDTFKKHLEIAFALNCKYVGTETGSLMGSPWHYVPENHGEAALKQVIEIMKDLSKTAEKNSAYIAVEGAYAHVAYNPKRVKRIIDEVQSPNIKVTIDLFNFLNNENYASHLNILDEAIDLLKEHIVIYHLKDFIVSDGKLKQVGLGQGLMDYPKIIKKIKQSSPDALLIFEGVTGDDIQDSYQFISKLLEGKCDS
jgi:sugar phosphate isomerase/epimerase